MSTPSRNGSIAAAPGVRLVVVDKVPGVGHLRVLAAGQHADHLLGLGAAQFAVEAAHHEGGAADLGQLLPVRVVDPGLAGLEHLAAGEDRAPAVRRDSAMTSAKNSPRDGFGRSTQGSSSPNHLRTSARVAKGTGQDLNQSSHSRCEAAPSAEARMSQMIRPRTRSGRFAASCQAVSAPMEWPMRTTGARPSCSSAASASSTYASRCTGPRRACRCGRGRAGRGRRRGAARRASGRWPPSARHGPSGRAVTARPACRSTSRGLGRIGELPGGEPYAARSGHVDAPHHTSGTPLDPLGFLVPHESAAAPVLARRSAAPCWCSLVSRCCPASRA